MSKKIQWLGKSDGGRYGSPGSRFVKRFAGVHRTASGQYELRLEWATGSNQGYFREDESDSRRFRSGDLEELLRIGISEVRDDAKFGSNEFAQAIRDAIYSAQDAESEEAELVRLGDLGTAHVWFVSVGQPAGCDLLAEDELSLPGDQIGGDGPWWDLFGTVGEDGRWEWDGEGSPKDALGNSVQRIVAFPAE